MDRQEMIEKGKTLFKGKSASSDEIEVWKESSLKYQAKYQESIQINQEIKLLLESCLSAKEALIKDLAAANEFIFQNNLKRDVGHGSYASKATQTLIIVESIETQTNSFGPKTNEKTSILPASTQTDTIESLSESNDNLENAKSQLSHIRDAYERAQSQMQMLGNANAQLKVDLENEKKISALLEAEVNALPDYIQKYHSERKTLLEKLIYEREKVAALTQKIQQISKSNIDELLDTKKNEFFESVKTPSPISPITFAPHTDIKTTEIIEKISDVKGEEGSLEIQNDAVKNRLKTEQIQPENNVSVTKDPMVLSPAPISISQQHTYEAPTDDHGPNADTVSETEKASFKQGSLQQDLEKTLNQDSNQVQSLSEKADVLEIEETGKSSENKAHSLEETKSYNVSSNHSHDAHLTVETFARNKNVITPLISPDILSSLPMKDADLLSSTSDNIPLALLYGQSICYNCQYYKDINL